MYCPECGYKIEEEDARFCSECGTKVSEDVQNDVQERCIDFVDTDEGDILGDAVDGVKELGGKILDAFEDVCAKKIAKGAAKFVSGLFVHEKHTVDLVVPRDASINLYGVIFTNIKLLAIKFGVSENTINGLLEDFIEQKQKCGVYYHLINVDNYTFLNENKTVHLDTSCKELWSYMEILNDFQNYAEDHSLPEFRYLFIIGGDDIIPMARIKHYRLKERDGWKEKDIETDMLYAYSYNPDMISKMERQEIFEYDQRFHIGRLPMGKDTTLDDFSGYLKRCIACSDKGIPMHNAYVQSDPNMKQTAVTAIKTLNDGRWLRNLCHLSDDKYYDGIILSPEFVAEDLNLVFDRDASLYHFSLHGNDANECRGYVGCPFLQERGGKLTVLPEHLASCRKPNAVTAISCYGARFIGRDKWHSMMLSALYSSSLLFVGSSKIAYGFVPPKSPKGKYVRIGHGDKLISGVVDSLMKGETAGVSLCKGRDIVCLDKCEFQRLNSAEYATAINICSTTIVEFNLYGDPTLRFNVPKCDVANYNVVMDRNAFKVGSLNECVVENVDLPSASTSVSILDMVRRKVDDNIASIHDMVGRNLYLQYGIEPRKADSIVRLKYANGTSGLNFNYTVNADSLMPIHYIVETTEKGEILNVITTK